MADYEVSGTYKFGGQSWDEMFHKANLDSAPACVTAFAPVADALLAMMHGGVILDTVQAANLNRLGRDAKTVTYEVTNGTSPVPPDVTNTCAKFTLYGSDGANRKLSVSGLADEDVVRNTPGASTPSPAFVQKKNDFIAALLAANLSIRQLVLPTPTGPTSWWSVSKMEPDSETVMTVTTVYDGFTKITTRGSHGIVKGDVVMFKRDREDPLTRGLVGEHKVVDATATTLLLNTRYWPREATYAPTGTWVRKVTFVLVPITSAQFDKFGSRQRGSGQGLRGRASGVSFRH